jgi:hypothetical protein
MYTLVLKLDFDVEIQNRVKGWNYCEHYFKMVLPRLLRQMRFSCCMPYLSFEHYSSQARVVLYFKYHFHWEHGIKLSASKKLAVEGHVKSTLSVVPLYLPVTALKATSQDHLLMGQEMISGLHTQKCF